MKSKIHFREFALLMALLMSIVSFSIDAVLPALGEVGRVFELKNNNQTQWVIIVKLLYYSYKIRKKLEITHRLSRSTILYAYV